MTKLHFADVEMLRFVSTGGCGNDIHSSVNGLLNTSTTFTCIQSSSPIALCVMHLHRRLDKGIHCHGFCLFVCNHIAFGR